MCLTQKLSLILILLTLLQDSTFHFKDVVATTESQTLGDNWPLNFLSKKWSIRTQDEIIFTFKYLASSSRKIGAL